MGGGGGGGSEGKYINSQPLNSIQKKKKKNCPAAGNWTQDLQITNPALNH